MMGVVRSDIDSQAKPFASNAKCVTNCLSRFTFKLYLQDWFLAACRGKYALGLTDHVRR
jgi:hypothetical protein